MSAKLLIILAGQGSARKYAILSATPLHLEFMPPINGMTEVGSFACDHKFRLINVQLYPFRSLSFFFCVRLLRRPCRQYA